MTSLHGWMYYDANVFDDDKSISRENFSTQVVEPATQPTTPACSTIHNPPQFTEPDGAN